MKCFEPFAIMQDSEHLQPAFSTTVEYKSEDAILHSIADTVVEEEYMVYGLVHLPLQQVPPICAQS